MADEAADVANITVKFTSSDKSAGQISIPLESTIGELKEAIRYGGESGGRPVGDPIWA